MTGTWRAKVHTDPKANPIAQASFLVEDFVPERLELKLEPAAQALSPQEPGTIKLAGRYLYGPPAAGLAVEGEIAVKPRQGRPAGLCRLQVRPRRRAGGARAQAAGGPARHRRRGQGRHRRAAARAAQDQPAAGGRRDPEAQGVRRAHHRAHRHAARRPEERPASASSRCSRAARREEGETARFEAIVLGADGKAVEAKGLKWELLRLDQRWQWYSRDGSWNYESVTQHAPRRHRHGRRRAGHAGQDRGQGRLGPLSPRGQRRRRLGPHLQRGVQRRLLRRRGRRQPRDARRRARQAVLPGRRDGARQDRLAHGRPRADRRAELRPGQHAGGRSAGRRRRGADPRQRRLEPRRLRHASCSTGRMDEKAKRMPGRALGLRWLAVDQAPRMLKVGLERRRR